MKNQNFSVVAFVVAISSLVSCGRHAEEARDTVANPTVSTALWTLANVPAVQNNQWQAFGSNVQGQRVVEKLFEVRNQLVRTRSTSSSTAALSSILSSSASKSSGSSSGLPGTPGIGSGALSTGPLFGGSSSPATSMGLTSSTLLTSPPIASGALSPTPEFLTTYSSGGAPATAAQLTTAVCNLLEGIIDMSYACESMTPPATSSASWAATCTSISDTVVSGEVGATSIPASVVDTLACIGNRLKVDHVTVGTTCVSTAIKASFSECGITIPSSAF